MALLSHFDVLINLIVIINIKPFKSMKFTFLLSFIFVAVVFTSCSKEENLAEKSSKSNTNISSRSSGLATDQAITVLGERVLHENDYSCIYGTEAICGMLFDPAIVSGSEVFLNDNEYLTTFTIQNDDTLIFDNEDWEFKATFGGGVEFPSNTITVIENTHLPVQVCEYFGLVGLPVIQPGTYEVLIDNDGNPYFTFHFHHDDDHEVLPHYNPTYPPLLTIVSTTENWDYDLGEIVSSTICWKYTPWILPAGASTTLPWDTEFTITVKRLPSCMKGPWTHFSQADLKNLMNDEDIEITKQVTQEFNYDPVSETWCYNFVFDEPKDGFETQCYVVQIRYPDGSSTYALISR